MIKGNKGEWSELYALVYLLATRNLYTADEHLNRMANFYFPILKIMRERNSDYQVDYMLSGEETVEIYVNSELTRTMTSEEFRKEADQLLVDIPNGSGRSFNIPHGEEFMKEIHCDRLTAPSDDITDIKMEVHDTITGLDQVMGFSVKSYLGGEPTLLNASGATNFVYEVIGISDQQMKEINEINSSKKIIERIDRIYSYGGEIKFVKAANDTFSANLMMIDSKMEDIIAEMLFYYYKTNESDCRKVIEHLEELNPLNYPRPGFYEYKFKQFLCAKALGLNPSEPWNGIDDANGGYIVVKTDGDVLAYHLYNRNKFQQYLFDETKFERASTSRHNYASIYRENDKMYINLNLDIRFKAWSHN